MSIGSIAVDYEELRRLSRVWAGSSRSLAAQALSVASLVTEPCVAVNAVFDPLGAARVERLILEAAAVPHGLAAMSVRLAADSIALEAVVVKEQLVDDFPIRELAAFDEWLLTAAIRLPFAPMQTLHAGRHAAAALGNATLGYLAPFAEPLLALAAPSPVFRADVADRRPLEVDPVFGLPLALVGSVAPEGPGYAAVSGFRPAWADTPAGSLGSAMRRVADLETSPLPALAVEAVAGRDGVTRYVVELPGMRYMGRSSDPQDLTGSIDAMVSPATAYTRCVVDALDEVGVPPGAAVMLVGHSEGGIVAMDLAGDSAFNGGRVRVTHVVAAGAPISSKQVAAGSGTSVFSAENVNDIVTHLDAVDSADEHQSPARLTYQFSADDHDVVGTHDPFRYAARIDGLADSPNPLFRGFAARVAPYFSGRTSTTVFTLADAQPG